MAQRAAARRATSASSFWHMRWRVCVLCFCGNCHNYVNVKQVCNMLLSSSGSLRDPPVEWMIAFGIRMLWWSHLCDRSLCWSFGFVVSSAACVRCKPTHTNHCLIWHVAVLLGQARWQATNNKWQWRGRFMLREGCSGNQPNMFRNSNYHNCVSVGWQNKN